MPPRGWTKAKDAIEREAMRKKRGNRRYYKKHRAAFLLVIKCRSSGIIVTMAEARRMIEANQNGKLEVSLPPKSVVMELRNLAGN